MNKDEIISLQEELIENQKATIAAQKNYVAIIRRKNKYIKVTI